MKNFLRCTHGGSAVEFALVILPVVVFVLGIMQTAFILWSDNLLQLSLNTAARCAAVNSATAPCSTSTDSTTKMTATATAILAPLIDLGFEPTFSVNDCAGRGLVGTMNVTFLVIDFALTARSCYPNVS